MPDISWAVSRLDLTALLDIALVALIFYGALTSIQGTRAVQLLWGVVIFVAAVVLSNLLQLTALSWLFRNSIPALFVAIPVIFQPELRRALERLGRTGGLLNRPLGVRSGANGSATVDDICGACSSLASRRFGALIVVEQGTGLQEYADTGVIVDAVVTERILLTIFYPSAPLHDGAAIIRGDRLLAAGCVLPLSEIWHGDQSLGTRHRAALGVSEESDAIAIVVSEETGTISVAQNGQLTRGLDHVRLKEMLLKARHAQQGDPWHLPRLASRPRDETSSSG